MKIFNCDACRALVFFENVMCLSCGHALGFLPDIMDMAALEPEGQGAWRSLAAHAPRSATHAPRSATHASRTATHAPRTATHAPRTAAHTSRTAASRFSVPAGADH